MLSSSNPSSREAKTAKIHFIDVTNRDGVQTAGLGLPKLKKFSNWQDMLTSRRDRPLIEDELLFIAKHPKLAKKLLTLMPPD